MSKFPRFHLIGTAAVGLLMATVPATAYTGQRLEKHAKISMDQARAIALKVFPGIVTDTELEHEKGGSGLRYSFDIREHSHEDGTVWEEVGVDAKTGKVLENKVEDGPHRD